MLDIKLIRKDPEYLKNALARRRMDPSIIDEIYGFDNRWRECTKQADDLKNARNVESKKIGEMKKRGEDIDAQSVMVKEIGNRIRELDEEIKELDQNINNIVCRIPNVPADKVPSGPDETYNLEVRKWGEIPKFDFTPLPHWDITEKLDIVDSPRAVKIAQTRFVMMKGMGARLERALINFMLDLHTRKHGYTEILPPQLVNSNTMYGTGQLPKFAEDLFKCENSDLYLIPTSEVPVTNMYAGEILNEEDLPLYYTAFSACYRSEAGSAGRDTRGLTRVHQFNKVEMVKFCHPDRSFDELEKMTGDAEEVLQLLEIPYRVRLLCDGDMGFSSAMTYDLEYWAPGQNRWVEVSSCSNCTDFQARRANIRFKPAGGGKTDFVHTLNGSGLALGRTVAAIIENYQNADASVNIPKALMPFMDNISVINNRSLNHASL